MTQHTVLVETTEMMWKNRNSVPCTIGCVRASCLSTRECRSRAALEGHNAIYVQQKRSTTSKASTPILDNN